MKILMDHVVLVQVLALFVNPRVNVLNALKDIIYQITDAKNHAFLLVRDVIFLHIINVRLA